MTKKGILILGSGKVSAPLVHYFLQRKYNVTVASEHVYQGEYLIQNNPLGKAIEWHSSESHKLHALVKRHQVVVSLLPYQFHLDVCKVCITERTNMVTTSYQQPGMSELHSDACKNNITIINEAGLDPGIDHMWAMQLIDTIRDKGGVVKKFVSLCGALPAPESLDNPFRYKFSWSPVGVLKASIADASFLKNGERISIQGMELLRNTFPVEIPSIGELEAYANRDSYQYSDLYETNEAVTFFRGTIRYKGWCETLATLIQVGFFSQDIIPEGIDNYADLTQYLFKLDGLNIRNEVALKLKKDVHSNSILAMEWLGLFSNNKFNAKLNTPFQILTHKMISKMKMLPSDMDLVILQHLIEYETKDHSTKAVKCTFTSTGKNDERTAIADTVSIPAAIISELLINNQIAHKGIIRPIYKEIYNPVLTKLRTKFNFKFNEKMIDEKDWPMGW